MQGGSATMPRTRKESVITDRKPGPRGNRKDETERYTGRATPPTWLDFQCKDERCFPRPSSPDFQGPEANERAISEAESYEDHLLTVRRCLQVPSHNTTPSKTLRCAAPVLCV